MPEELRRRLAAILAADAVGYSRLMEDDEEGALARLKQCRRILDEAVERFHGRVFGGAGDSIVAEFASPVEAVRCAVAAQAGLGEFGASLPPESRMPFRIGIHLGDVIVDGDNLYGDGVNVAARLEQLADPGGILVSEDIVRQVGGKADAEFEAAGEHRLKNILRPVIVHRMILADPKGKRPANEQDRPYSPAARPEKPVVAVQPFRNLSGDPDQDYFADGIGEDIVTGLSKIPDILVISRDRSFGTEEKPFSVQQAREQHGARFMLEGSVRRAGERIRVTAQLADAETGTRLWADRYDRDLGDVFNVQDEVVGSILHALGAADGVIERAMRRRSQESRPDILSAYDCYLQARDQFYRHGDEGFDAAESLYRKAIALDGTFARAHSALAWLHFVRFKLFQTASFEDIRTDAYDLAQRALQLDPNDFRAHWVLGGLYLHDGRHEQSVTEFDKALRNNPNDANLLSWSAEVLVYCGRTAEALERCDEAIRLNPNCPDWYHWIRASALFHLGRYDDALAALERMSAPEHAGRLKAATLAHLGRMQEAGREAEAFLRLVPGFSIGKWSRTEFYADPAELERYVDGLRKAGLPG